MGMQQEEYEFPDEKDETTQEVEVPDFEEEDNDKIDVDGAVGREAMVGSKPKAEQELEIEVEDDTPPEDRGRTPSEPPKDVTEDELEDYSEKVKNRIKHFSKGYHDERRAKEAAMREREALEDYARKLMEENQALKGTVDKNQNTMLEQAKQTVAGELAAAKRMYKEAYEAGDADAIVEAQEAIATAKIRADKVANFKPASLHREETPVQVPQTPEESPKTQVDQRANAWAEENSWFGPNDEMTSFALGLHNKLVKEGINPQSDTYYEKIDSRMRQVFPEEFNDSESTQVEAGATKKPSSSVVAPATRSTAPKKVKLTKTQVALAKRLGLPLQVYAKQVAEDMRKQR
jgi:hypothetical protein